MSSTDPGDHRFVSRLRQEVEVWSRDGDITPEQARAILARYPETPAAGESSRRRQRLVAGLAILGSVLIGLGVITFYAANWDEIPRGLRLASLLAAMLLAYGAGYAIWQRRGLTPHAAAFLLLGCIIYGAGVHLTAQIYHVPVNHPDLSLMWLLGVVPLAYVTRSRPIMFLSIALFLGTVGFRLQDWLRGVDGAVAVTSLYVALGALLYAVGKAKGQLRGWDSIGMLFASLGMITAFAALYLLTFHDLFDGAEAVTGASIGYWLLLCCASAVAAGLVAGIAWRRSRGEERAAADSAEAGAISLLLLAIILAVALSAGWDPLFPIVFNVLFVLLALGLMASGYLRDREGRVNLSLALIALYVITRYFEYAIGSLDTSLIFLGAGAVLLAGGYVLERLRRRMLANMRGREGGP